MKYLSYYGMERNPFIKEIEVSDLYESDDFKEGYARLEYLKEIKGIGLITGVVGVGKTSLLRKFKESLNPEKYNIIYVSITNIGKFEFLNIICKSLGISTGNCYLGSIKRKIQETIKKEKENYGKETIVLIDNAEKLTKEMLMDMEYLYEFDYNSYDYTSIILCGNDEIRDELSKKIYESFRQRILCMYKMEGLRKDEIKDYISSRLKMVNQTNKIFTDNAINGLGSASYGIVRKLNTLINLCLMIGYEYKKQIIDEEIVRFAINENKL